MNLLLQLQLYIITQWLSYFVVVFFVCFCFTKRKHNSFVYTCHTVFAVVPCSNTQLVTKKIYFLLYAILFHSCVYFILILDLGISWAGCIVYICLHYYSEMKCSLSEICSLFRKYDSCQEKVFKFYCFEDVNLLADWCSSVAGQLRLNFTHFYETTRCWRFGIDRNRPDMRMNFICTVPGWDNMGEIRVFHVKSTDFLFSHGKRGGSVVECRTPEREVRGSRPTAAVLCPWARHFTPRKYWLITQEAMALSRHDWKIVDWDVKPQHNQPTFSHIPIHTTLNGPFNQRWQNRSHIAARGISLATLRISYKQCTTSLTFQVVGWLLS